MAVDIHKLVVGQEIKVTTAIRNLKVGQVVTISNFTIRSFGTSIWLEGYSDPFDSNNFDDIKLKKS